jgi:hypothetical protein
MTPEARLRRIGWFALLALCAALYGALHLKVQSVHSDVVRAERRIVQLEGANLLLETEYLTRSNQLQLARWNRVEFGYSAPEAGQFLQSERQLASFSGQPFEQGRAAIRFANASVDEEPNAPEVARLVSPLTGEEVDPALLAPERASENQGAPRLAVMLPQGPTRVQLTALAGASVP